jgi:hypothetical protein
MNEGINAPQEGTPLTPSTHARLLGETLRHALGPEGRKVKHEGISSYRHAIEDEVIDPSDLGPRSVVHATPIPDTNKVEEVSITTFGESSGVSDPTEEGARNLAEIIVYVGWDLEHEANPDEVGILEARVGLNDHAEATYEFLEYREDPDPADTEKMYTYYDKWGVPRKTEDNTEGGKLTNEQGTTLWEELRKR